MSVKITRDLPVGHVTSGTFSPTLRKGVALALVNHQVQLGAEVLVAGDRGPARLVGGQQVVDDRVGLAAGALGGADPVGVGAQHLDVDHAGQPSAGRRAAQDLVRVRADPASRARAGGAGILDGLWSAAPLPARRC